MVEFSVKWPYKTSRNAARTRNKSKDVRNAMSLLKSMCKIDYRVNSFTNINQLPSVVATEVQVFI